MVDLIFSNENLDNLFARFLSVPTDIQQTLCLNCICNACIRCDMREFYLELRQPNLRFLIGVPDVALMILEESK